MHKCVTRALATPSSSSQPQQETASSKKQQQQKAAGSSKQQQAATAVSIGKRQREAAAVENRQASMQAREAETKEAATTSAKKKTFILVSVSTWGNYLQERCDGSQNWQCHSTKADKEEGEVVHSTDDHCLPRAVFFWAIDPPSRAFSPICLHNLRVDPSELMSRPVILVHKAHVTPNVIQVEQKEQGHGVQDEAGGCAARSDDHVGIQGTKDHHPIVHKTIHEKVETSSHLVFWCVILDVLEDVPDFLNGVPFILGNTESVEDK